LVCTYCGWKTKGDSLVMPRPMGVWPGFKVQSSHFPGRAFHRHNLAEVVGRAVLPFVMYAGRFRNCVCAERSRIGGARKKWGSQKPRATLRREVHTAQEVLEARVGARGLFQLCVLRLGFLEDGNIRVGFFPEREEILIDSGGLGGVALHGVSTRQSQPLALRWDSPYPSTSLCG